LLQIPGIKYQEQNKLAENKENGEGARDLFFVEHWDLNKNNREVKIARFYIILHGLPFVSLLWFLPKELNEDETIPM
jgi:hypothetical protein